MCESSLVLQRPKTGVDAAGGTTQDWVSNSVTLLTNIPCSQQEAGAMKKQYYMMNNAEVTTTIYTAQDIQAEPNDRLIVTDRNGFPVYYLVQGQSQPVGRGRLWGTDCVRVRGPKVRN